MSQDYMWFDIDANKKIGKKQLRVLNQIYIEDTLINYLINPLNRTILNDVPNMIENIEQHTIRATPSDDAQDKWNEDKEGTFIHMLEEAYKNLMNDPLESLVETYIPNMENLGKNPKRGTYWEKLEDFKGEKHYTNPETEEIELLEGTGISSTLKLGDLLDKTEAKKFIGEQISIGSGRGKYKSKLQKKLRNGTRKFNPKELYGLNPRDDSVLSFISVEFLKEDKPYDDSKDAKPKPANYGIIRVKFSIDHTNGTVSKKIFEKAGLTKWATEDDPSGYGKSIREGGYSQGWRFMNDRPSTASKRDKAWDLDAIWWTPKLPMHAAQKEKDRE